MNNFFPLDTAYRPYGIFDLPGYGLDTGSGPLSNHLVVTNGEANEIDYSTSSGYRSSDAMYELNNSPPYIHPPVPYFPAQPVSVGQPPPTPPRPKPPENSVLDYNQLQGTNNPTDLTHQILRDVNYRYITVQNSSYRPIGVGITTYSDGTVPGIRFIAEPGMVRHLGINSQGGPAQFLWPLDPETGRQVGTSNVLSRDANDFVLRDGINGWNLQNFIRPSYRAAF